MTIGDPNNSRRERVRRAASDAVDVQVRELVSQRDDLLEAIEFWMDAIESDPGNAATADEELMSCFSAVRERVWEGS